MSNYRHVAVIWHGDIAYLHDPCTVLGEFHRLGALMIDLDENVFA